MQLLLPATVRAAECSCSGCTTQFIGVCNALGGVSTSAWRARLDVTHVCCMQGCLLGLMLSYVLAFCHCSCLDDTHCAVVQWHPGLFFSCKSRVIYLTRWPHLLQGLRFSHQLAPHPRSQVCVWVHVSVRQPLAQCLSRAAAGACC